MYIGIILLHYYVREHAHTRVLCALTREWLVSSNEAIANFE